MGKKVKKVQENKQKKQNLLNGQQQEVFDYMKKQNRPYSAQNVFDNLRGSVKKNQCAKILDGLSSKNYLKAKDYGKQRIYLLNQELLNSIQDIGDLQQDINLNQQLVQTHLEQAKSLQIKLKELQQTMSQQELDQKIATESEKLFKLKNQVSSLQSEQPVTLQEKQAILALFAKNKAQEAKRKKICFNMLSTISQMLDQPLKSTKKIVDFED